MPPARSKRPAAAADAAPAKRVCTDAVGVDARALRWAGPALQADRPVVLAAVRQNGGALQWASPVLRADREVVLAAVAQDGWALQHASAALRADRPVVLAAVTQAGWALKWASPALKADRDIVLVARTQNGRALQHAVPALRHDPDVVLVARARALERDEPLQDVADVLCSPKRKHGPFAGAVRATKMQRCRLDQHTDAPERCPGTDIPNLIE